MAKKRTRIIGFGKRHQQAESLARKLMQAGQHEAAKEVLGGMRENLRARQQAIADRAGWDC